MSTHNGGNDSSAGSAGQAQAQVHTKDKFAEEPAGKRGTIGEHTMSGINAASSYSGKLQSPVTLLVTKSNSDNDENGWHKDNNSDCDDQVDDDKDLLVRLADGLTQEDKMPQGMTACAQATIDGGMVH